MPIEPTIGPGAPPNDNSSYRFSPPPKNYRVENTSHSDPRLGKTPNILWDGQLEGMSAADIRLHP